MITEINETNETINRNYNRQFRVTQVLYEDPRPCFRAYTHWIFLHTILRHYDNKKLRHLIILSQGFLTFYVLTNQGKLLENPNIPGVEFC